MEAVIISQTYRTEAHVDSDPDIHHNDIAKKFIPAYHNVADDIYQNCRKAEIYKKLCFGKYKKGHKSENHNKNGRIYQIC